jgi:hypothetical protein
MEQWRLSRGAHAPAHLPRVATGALAGRRKAYFTRNSNAKEGGCVPVSAGGFRARPFFARRRASAGRARLCRALESFRRDECQVFHTVSPYRGAGTGDRRRLFRARQKRARNARCNFPKKRKARWQPYGQVLIGHPADVAGDGPNAGQGVGADHTAQLFGGADANSLSALFPTTTFRTSSQAAQGYVNGVEGMYPDSRPDPKRRLS